MKRAKIKICLFALALVFFAHTSWCVQNSSRPPYSIQKALSRAEELFKDNNYREALIFYYEALLLTKNAEVAARTHFRIGECLEAIRRFEFASYHYGLAADGKLPDLLVSRAIMKLEHLPEMAQKEEAMRLFNHSMLLYRKKNLRQAIDEYLESIKMMPSLMAKDESGLIEDAVKYLTYLSENKEREPDRLLKLASLLELRGDIEKSTETLQQIIIIYPDTDEARQAEFKLENFAGRQTAYFEQNTPSSASQAVKGEQVLVFEDNFSFKNVGAISRQLERAAFTLRAYNEQVGIPAERFEFFTVTFGLNAEQQEFCFSAEEGIDRQSLEFKTENLKYELIFESINQTKGYVQDLYGDGKRAITLFADISVRVKIYRLTE